MSLETILASLTHNEKVAALDILWRDLSAKPPQFSSPDWHGRVLSDRINKPSSEPKLSVEEAILDVKERLNARRIKG